VKPKRLLVWKISGMYKKVSTQNTLFERVESPEGEKDNTATGLVLVLSILQKKLQSFQDVSKNVSEIHDIAGSAK
jgi:hypothetical protein